MTCELDGNEATHSTWDGMKLCPECADMYEETTGIEVRTLDEV